MTHQEFDKIFQEQVRLCESILCTKAREYSASDDRLHNFNVAADFTEQRNPIAALSGMLLKHIVSLYDMMEDRNPLRFSNALWNEKLTDAMNYLFLLRALIIDARQNEGCDSDADTTRHVEAAASSDCDKCVKAI